MRKIIFLHLSLLASILALRLSQTIFSPQKAQFFPLTLFFYCNRLPSLHRKKYWQVHLICNLKINTHSTFTVIQEQVDSRKKYELPKLMFPGEQDHALLYCFSSLLKQCPFCYLVPHSFHFMEIISCLKLPPSIVMKWKKAIMCLMGKNCVFHLLCSDMTYSVAGHKCNVK